MSKLLLDKGFNADQTAKLVAYAHHVKTVNKRDLSSLTAARSILNQMYDMVARKLNSSDYESFMLLMKACFDISFGHCYWSGEKYPMSMLVAIPDGRDRLARADMLLQNDWEWEYSEEGTIIRAGRLYGDKNVLNYTTNPLQYLKFRCLPSERLSFDIKNDSCINDDYSGVANVFLGVELEVERKKDTPKKIEHMVVADLGMDYVILKSDGSLQDGFEIVTAPATLGFHLQAWDKFFANSAKHLVSWTSGRCGMHVHIARNALTPMHLGKLIAFINNNENREFVTSIAGRSSQYSKFIEDRAFHVKTKLISYIEQLYKQIKETKSKDDIITIEKKISDARSKLASTKGSSLMNLVQDIEHGGERHSAINLTKQGTIEIRLFRGNVVKVGMLKNLEFVHAAVTFTREATFRTSVLNAKELEERKLKRKENTDYALHYTYFLDWLEKDTTGNYNNLKQWLQTHKLTDKFAKKKVSSKTPPDKRLSDDDIRAVA